jgi:hypothetical protein
MTDHRQRAWSDIHDLLPEGWSVGPTSYEPGGRKWTVAEHAMKRRSSPRSRT